MYSQKNLGQHTKNWFFLRSFLMYATPRSRVGMTRRRLPRPFSTWCALVPRGHPLVRTFQRLSRRPNIYEVNRRDKKWKVRTKGWPLGTSAHLAHPSFFRIVMSLGKSSGPRNDFQSHFSRSFFGKKIFLDIFWRSFRGLKTYSEKKDSWVRTFKQDIFP